MKKNSKITEIGDERKEKFILEIRNSFTHKGISIGNGAEGIFDIEEGILEPGEKEPKWGFSPILQKKIKEDSFLFAVRRWPFVLIEIIEDTLKNNPLRNEKS